MYLEVGTFKPERGLSLGLSSNPSIDVVCFGEILFDCLFDEVPVGENKDGTVKFQSFPGGAPANVACALSKLGLKSAFVGSVGNDEEGSELLSLLSNIGVDSQFCARTEDYPTRKVMVARKSNGDREFAGFWNNAPTLSFADVYYSPSRLSWERLSALVTSDSLSAVVVGTLGLAYESPTKSCMDNLRTLLRSIDHMVRMRYCDNYIVFGGFSRKSRTCRRSGLCSSLISIGAPFSGAGATTTQLRKTGFSGTCPIRQTLSS